MKKIEALICHRQLEDVESALGQQGNHGMTVSEVRGFGARKGPTERYRGGHHAADFLPEIKIEIVVADADLPRILETIIQTTKTGQVGDANIFVTNLDHVLRIRTGENGNQVFCMPVRAIPNGREPWPHTKAFDKGGFN